MQDFHVICMKQNQVIYDLNIKSKVMICNKVSRLSNVKFYIDETELEIVRHYKYLGIMLSLN
jgi:hypothetical protein